MLVLSFMAVQYAPIQAEAKAKDEADSNARPAIKEPLASVAQYDKRHISVSLGAFFNDRIWYVAVLKNNRMRKVVGT